METMHTETSQVINASLDRIVININTLAEWLRSNPEPKTSDWAVRLGMRSLILEGDETDEECRWRIADHAEKAQKFLRNFGMLGLFEIAHARWEARKAIVVGARVRA